MALIAPMIWKSAFQCQRLRKFGSSNFLVKPGDGCSPLAVDETLDMRPTSAGRQGSNAEKSPRLNAIPRVTMIELDMDDINPSLR